MNKTVKTWKNNGFEISVMGTNTYVFDSIGGSIGLRLVETGC